MHPVYALAFVTFICIVGFLGWNYVSTKRHGAKTGAGGPADPLSGTTDVHIRSGEEIRQSLDAAQKEWETKTAHFAPHSPLDKGEVAGEDVKPEAVAHSA